jgi:hypothetical protein
MSTLTVLKEYLVGTDGYLLNDDNNGKTVMLSGAWGSGKTHFWQKSIEPKLRIELKEKACAYISLYGMDSLKEIKEEVFFKASKENDYLAEEIEVFGFDALSTIADNGGEISKGLKTIFDLNKYRRSSKGKNKLKDGGLICFDDFERKSKNIDLNDLFGFIFQLAIGLNCKVVIILNSDVFEGEEANVFKTVKEKTVNKFFYFEPTIEELFDSIYSNKKYTRLDEYKNKILNAIKETEELNARIYIQVLDNCLEWIEKNYEAKLKALIFTTIYFIKTHALLSYSEVCEFSSKWSIKYSLNNEYSSNLLQLIESVSEMEKESEKFGEISIIGYKDFLYDKSFINFFDEISSQIKQQDDLSFIKKQRRKLCEFWKYGYRLYYMDTVDKTTYEVMANFIKTGILPKKDEESLL